MTYRRIVLFRVHDDVTEELLGETIDEMSAMTAFPGLVAWTFVKSLDARKGRVLVEDASFTDGDACRKFRAHPSHRAAGELRAISDWWVGDYVSDD